MSDIVYDKICLMAPTYKRVGDKLPRFIDSAISTVSDPSRIHMCFCVNQADRESIDYLEGRDLPCGKTVVIEPTSQPNLAYYFNLMYGLTEHLGEATVVSMTGDDMIFVTDHYDKFILDLINHYDGIGVFWCNDDYIAKERLPVNLFVTRKFVQATEEPFMCEKYPADMIDYVWGKVGKYTRTCHYLPDVVIRHDHTTKKQPEDWDETYRRLRPAQADAHSKFGKPYARELAKKIALRLAAKGMTGDSV